MGLSMDLISFLTHMCWPALSTFCLCLHLETQGRQVGNFRACLFPSLRVASLLISKVVHILGHFKIWTTHWLCWVYVCWCSLWILLLVSISNHMSQFLIINLFLYTLAVLRSELYLYFVVIGWADVRIGFFCLWNSSELLRRLMICL